MRPSKGLTGMAIAVVIALLILLVNPKTCGRSFGLNDIIQISAKNLGNLAMPNCCLRCFWLKINCKLPYQIFPGILSSIDSFSKKTTWGYYEEFGTLPNWFKPFGDFARPVKAPGRSVFFVNDERTNVKLIGIVDDHTPQIRKVRLPQN